MPIRKRLCRGMAAVLMAAALVAPLAAQQESWEELNGKVISLYRQGKYGEAVSLAQEALRVAEERFGPEHPNVAMSLNNLAGLYKAQAKYAAAGPLYKRSLAIRVKALGAYHPSVATSLNDLAELYRAQSRYSEAEPLYKRSLVIREKALGPDSEAVARSLESYAALLRKTNRAACENRKLRRGSGIHFA